MIAHAFQGLSELGCTSGELTRKNAGTTENVVTQNPLAQESFARNVEHTGQNPTSCKSPLTRLCEAVAGAFIQPLRINCQQVGFARSFKAGIRDAILFCLLDFVTTPCSGAPFVHHQPET